MKNRIKELGTHPLLKNSIIYVITDVINKAVPFLILPLLSFYLTPSDYGIVTNYNVYISILAIFIGLNVQSILSINFNKLKKADVSKYIFNILIVISVSFIFCIVSIICLQNILTKTLSVGVNYILYGLLIAYSQVLSTINLTLWRLEERPLYFGTYQISQTITDLSLSLILIILFNLTWVGRLTGMGISTVFYGILSMILLWKRGYINLNYNTSYIKEVLKFGLPLIPHSLSLWARTGIDRIIISTLIGTAASGIYAAGFQFGLVISFLTLAFSNAYSPYLYKSLATTDQKKLIQIKKKLVKLTYLYTILLAVFAGLSIIASNFIIDHFLSLKYSESKEYVIWAILSQALQGVYLMYVLYIFYAKKSSRLASITFTCSVLQVLLTYYLVKTLGPLGAAYSNCIISFVNCIAVIIYSTRVYNMPWLSFYKD